ncbi:hypothetical protein BGW38_007729 [Lunasporangiospora selenospora]|uniref:Uncharacterized protein n=1 Tax=Lunasporangiospora selenospora TaxID=979761 RepID=A0A9P6FYB0_9FUNG|nr:hypothetical protein BGW38_007729 [Lunasporangiospora selenospora]
MPAPTAANQPSESSASVALPPGMVLGPDGKPCRTCTDWKGWKKLTKSAKPNDNSGSTTAATAATAAAAAATSASASSSNSEPGKTFNYEKECPPDREVLGRATWTFLRTSNKRP